MVVLVFRLFKLCDFKIDVIKIKWQLISDRAILVWHHTYLWFQIKLALRARLSPFLQKKPLNFPEAESRHCVWRTTYTKQYFYLPGTPIRCKTPPLTNPHPWAWRTGFVGSYCILNEHARISRPGNSFPSQNRPLCLYSDVPRLSDDVCLKLLYR